MNDMTTYIRFADIADFRNGLNFGKESHGRGCQLIGVSNFKDRFTPDYSNLEEINPEGIVSKEDFLKYGDILFVRSNGNKELVGRTLFINKNLQLLYSGFCIRARLNSQKITPEFCAYFTRTKRFRAFISSSGGTNIQNLNQKTLGDVKLPNMSIQEQNAITKVLSDLDTKIELNNRINAELEGMAKLIYDYWFVQFDFPISVAQAQAMGKPELEGKPYKSSGGKMVYSEELKREIPEEWEVSSFGRYANAKGGFAFKSGWWSKDGVPVIKIKDISENYTVNIESCSFVEIDKLKKAKGFQALPGDVVIAMTGATVGKYGIVPDIGKPILVNQRVAKFNLGSEPIKRLPFLINSLNQKYFRETIFIIAGGAAQPNISSDQIDNIPLLLPEPHILNNYNLRFSNLYWKIMCNIKQNQQLSSLRDWLLPMLMNGQVKVGETAENLSMAAEPEVNYGG